MARRVTPFARLDHHRQKRTGIPEVIYCEGKTPAQVKAIAREMFKRSRRLLATRADARMARAVRAAVRGSKYHELARCVTVGGRKPAGGAGIAVVTAGTSDLRVAEEAAVTAEFLGHPVDRIYDVGVAGVHRLLKHTARMREVDVVVVVAGMEGALPSVVAGLVAGPIIAVPTSVGYGASFGGIAALLAMMNACAPGVAVVNIDNGFGAAVVAASIRARLR